MNSAIEQGSATIRSPQAYETRESSLFLDVRMPTEFEDAHIDGAALHPLSDLNAEKVKILSAGKARCILVCRSGNRARQAAEKLKNGGIQNLLVLEGGISEWERAGLPLIRGRKSISLERQVRIAAGALVLLGVVLGVISNPFWFGLSAFVGAGLMFAGITDTCGMAMILAKMPWNKVSPSASSCSIANKQ